MAARSKAGIEKQQFNVFLSCDVVKELKHLAIERGESLSALVEKIFREQIELADKEGKWLPE
ncbi:MAG TPA: ribbon-helix-helix protein, CopG family [Myxococcota bacterium]|nr:ribbon-helix-helix protein, CopG family [Myxococcota bacterium]